jgi:Fe2+ or Zn2+ uptake regulation protein
VAEIEDPAVSSALAKAAEKAGFLPSNALVELDGTCAACANH